MMKNFTLLLIALSLCFMGHAQKPPKAEDVRAITQKVADWQIRTFADHGKYRALPAKENRHAWHHREPYHDLVWQAGALYAGMYELTTISDDTRYLDWLNMIGSRNRWKLHTRMYHADDHAVGQFYLSMSKYYYSARNTIAPTQKRFDEIMASDKADNWHWTWCDALFMAPPVWARLAKLTGDQKYLDYMDKQYHMTYDKLWSKKDHLYFRDQRYITKYEENGESLFWSRGNGWVFGGLALMIPDFPENWEGTEFYVTMFKQMAKVLKDTQRKDGTWSAGMLGDITAYPEIETSGSSFFTFGLAWGIANGVLDQKTYEPVLFKAWDAMVGAVNEEGMLGYVQPVGASPGASFKDYTELYGIGAFLAAGSEMYKYIEKMYPKKIKKDDYSQNVFLHDGGWCWYQSPRAIINNDKLIVGGLDGQNGDVRVGVYDLKKKKLDGEVVLHEKLEVDDHDAPAFYARPDGSILAMWAKHTREKAHHYKISSPDNYLKWGDAQKYVHEFKYPSGVAYMNLYYLENEKLLYNFFRDGQTFNPTYMTSADHGKTWGNRQHMITDEVNGRNRPYAVYEQIDGSTIGISYTDAHPRDYGNNLYYVEFKDGKFYKVDGTFISDIKDGALQTTRGEKLYAGSDTKKKPAGYESVPNSAWNCAMGKDADNNPHVGYTLYLSNSDHRFRISSWDGQKWNDREIAYAGKCLYSWESGYTGLMAFDPTDPTNVYISTDVDPTTGEDFGGRHEIYYAKIGATDDISTIKWKAITKNSTYRNIRPIVVAKDGHKVLVWLQGRWNSFTSYDVNVVGKVLK